ncbi:MAG: anthranilate phosphoribosyltransferase [Victivallales bacterium]|nr:anthranilate phosphoribosyltransferase [Victivallales bacterium]
MSDIRELLNRTMGRNDLSANEMEGILDELAAGTVHPAQAGALLAALRMKGEAVAEIVGGARMMRRHAEYIDCGGMDVVDIVGTGGDGGVSFNISTTSAFVAAGAGVAIAKHGTRAVSGKSGAADVLAALGYNLLCDAAQMENSIRENGIGFLFAQKLHPVMGKIAPIRKSLGIRTIFNLLGPLTNPAGARHLVIGVYDAKLTELFAEALRELGAEHALVVHGQDGLDEISCCDSTRITELRDGEIRSYEFFPQLLTGASYAPEEIAGGTPEENAAITRRILSGEEQGAPRAVVLLNAAAAIYVAGLAESIDGGVRLAAESIDSGAAQAKLEALVAASL